MLIYGLIANFRDFLNTGWSSVEKVMEHLEWDESPYFYDEWIQANWELLVEKHILKPGQLLAPYGYNSSPECRYSIKGGVLTHRVVCKKKGGFDFQYIFLCFKSRTGTEFKIEPPFDYVGVEDIETRDRSSVAFEELEFSVHSIEH